MFWLNVPFCLIVLAVVPLVYRESRSGETRALPDPFGGVMVATATALVTLGIVQSDPWGWFDWKAAGSIVGGLAVFGLFVQRSWHHPNPLVELRLFRLPNVRRSNMSMLIFASSWFAMFFGFTVIIIRSWGWTPLEGGFAVALGLTFATTAASASEAIDLLMGMVVITAVLSLPFSLRIDTRPR